MHSILFMVFLSRLIHFLQADTVDPEAYMSAVEMIRYWGYPAEVIDVHTADGYILDLFRIPHGRFSAANSSCIRPPMLLVHGFGAASPLFVMNPPESSPAYILADAGFDVFLLNHRGSTYSKRHITLSPWDNKFWQFTVDEMSKYDVPAVIDKVLEVTGQSSLYWTAHSQGTIVMTLADHPEYNSKIRALFQIGPVGTMTYAKGLFRTLFILYDALKPVADFYRLALGSHEVAFGIPFVYRALIRLCLMIPYLGPEVCKDGVYFISGAPAKTLNISRAAVYLSHIPSGTSTWNGLHLAQIASHRTVEHMDHNPLENIQRYGQETPPPYNYSKINAPVYLIWSRNDWATTADDIEHFIMKNLKSDVVKGGFEVPEYSHFDYSIATDCAEKVWNRIIEIVRSKESADICVR